MSNEQKTNAEKYPALWAEFTKLQSERESIHAQSAPLKSQRDALRQQADAIKDQEREIVEQIKAIERPRLSEIDEQLSRLAQAMGGRRMSDAG